jgi:pyruvate formate lyase activating enzyme
MGSRLENPKKVNKRRFLKLGMLSAGGACMMAGGLPLSAFSNSPVPGRENTHREAMFYSPTAKGMKCKICPNNCTIREGEYGDCRTRLHEHGKLYTIAWGNPCAVHVDPIEKKPLYHFLPQSNAFSIATAGCNLACLNCQNWDISQASPLDTRNHDLPPEMVIENCKYYDCKSIAYTYSDPVAFYEYTYDTSRIARVEGIKNILISAGYINPEPLREIAKYIDAANIDLKSFSNEIYEMLNAGTLQPVLDTLTFLKDNGIWLEITNLIVPEWTDDMDMIKKMCGWLTENGFEKYPLHFSRFHPQHKLAQLPPTPKSVLENAYQIAKNEGMEYVYIGNLPGGMQDTICPGCNKTVVERRGFSVISSNLRENKCANCKTEIPGVWQ